MLIQFDSCCLYDLYAQGVTLSGGVTKWSEKSEPMSTSADEHGHEAKPIQTDLVTIFAKIDSLVID